MAIKERLINNLDELQRIILLLLDANGQEPVKGKMWLQKEIFLIANNLESLKGECNFEPHYWGPYSDSLDGETEELVSLGVVMYDTNKIQLTSLGKEIVKNLKIDKKELELIHDMKSLINDLSKDEMLAFIYFAYPEYAEESVELKNISKKREKLIEALYRKGKISIERAAELENIPLAQVIKRYR